MSCLALYSDPTSENGPQYQLASTATGGAIVAVVMKLEFGTINHDHCKFEIIVAIDLIGAALAPLFITDGSPSSPFVIVQLSLLAPLLTGDARPRFFEEQVRRARSVDGR